MIININIYNLRCINQIEKCGCKNNLKKKKTQMSDRMEYRC